MFGQFLRGPLFEEHEAGNGGGGGTPAAFNPDEFSKALLKQVNETINGALAKHKKESAAASKGAGESDEERQAREEKERAGNQGGEKVDPKFAKLSRDFEKLTTQLEQEREGRKAAEDKAKEDRRRGEIKGKLSEYEYVKKTGAESAFKALQGDISYNEDGELVGPKGESFSEYIESQMNETLDTLLAPREKGGSGASSKRGSAAGKDEIDMDDIRPGMSKDAIEKARKKIASVLGDALRGR